jgi:hypothetical protein
LADVSSSHLIAGQLKLPSSWRYSLRSQVESKVRTQNIGSCSRAFPWMVNGWYLSLMGFISLEKKTGRPHPDPGTSWIPIEVGCFLSNHWNGIRWYNGIMDVNEWHFSYHFSNMWNSGVSALSSAPRIS